MKVGQLIRQLQTLQSTHGDLDVCIDVVGDVSGFMQAQAEQVYVREDEIVIEGDEENRK